MTRARREQVSLEATPYYHCICRCVRRAFLCGEDIVTHKSYEHRRQWIVDRLGFLTEIFAIDICGYAVMSNHYHVVLRINQDKALAWSEKEVIKRWCTLFKGNLLVERYRQGKTTGKAERLAVAKVVKLWRTRLFDLGWFMRCLNEHIARMANEEDGCKGRFWESRYKSQALLDEKALLVCMSYVDLNPIRAGMAKTPETSQYTSVHRRIHAKTTKQHTIPLLPFQGKERLNHNIDGIPFTKKDYLHLVDWSGRAIRNDKRGFIPHDLPPILQRLNIAPDDWLDAVQHAGHSYGIAMGHLVRIKAFAEKLGQRWLRCQSFSQKLYKPAPS